MVRKERVDKMTVNEPYFLSNKKWYYFDEEEWRYKLTDKATEEAIESYNEFYKQLEWKEAE